MLSYIDMGCADRFCTGTGAAGLGGVAHVRAGGDHDCGNLAGQTLWPVNIVEVVFSAVSTQNRRDSDCGAMWRLKSVCLLGLEHGGRARQETITTGGGVLRRRGTLRGEFNRK